MTGSGRHYLFYPFNLNISGSLATIFCVGMSFPPLGRIDHNPVPLSNICVWSIARAKRRDAFSLFLIRALWSRIL